ncbi:MAG: hypothetical protein ACOCP8_00950 [archaeon]
MMLVNVIHEYNTQEIKEKIRKDLKNNLKEMVKRDNTKDKIIEKNYLNNEESIIEGILKILKFKEYSFQDYDITLVILQNLTKKGNLENDEIIEKFPNSLMLNNIKFINKSLWYLCYELQEVIFKNNSLLFDYMDDSYNVEIVEKSELGKKINKIKNKIANNIEEWSGKKIKKIRQINHYNINNTDSLPQKIYKNRINKENENSSQIIEEKIRNFLINMTNNNLPEKITNTIVKIKNLEHLNNKVLITIRNLNKEESIYLENQELQQYYPVLNHYLQYLFKEKKE